MSAIVHCHWLRRDSVRRDDGWRCSRCITWARSSWACVPVWDIRKAGGADMLVRNNQLGARQTLGNRSAVLMRGHGAAITATSLHLVVGKAFYLNLNALAAGAGAPVGRRQGRLSKS